MINAPQVVQLMSGVTTNTNGAAVRMHFKACVYQATVVGTGAVAVNVTIQGSANGVNWSALGSAIALTATTTDTDKLVSVEYWPFIRAVTDSISGTGATVTVYAAG